jgi:hypothetical protein
MRSAAILGAIAAMALARDEHLLTEDERAARDKSPLDYAIRPVLHDPSSRREKIPRTVRDADRLAEARAKRQRRAAKALGIKPPDVLGDIAAAIEALKLGPPMTTIAVWSLGPEERPMRLHTSSGKIYLMGRTLFANLEREVERQAPPNLPAAPVLRGLAPSFAGVPIIDVDELSPLAKRNFAEMIKTALGATP